jgi:altronate dehydratase small subunit
MMRIDAIVLHPKDNVATALKDLRPGEEALMGVLDETKRMVVTEDIPYGHKFAIRDIKMGEEILKYGEVIGRATRAILSGAHAHIQNIESLRGRGDWKRNEE